jgi:hypothetical protein
MRDIRSKYHCCASCRHFASGREYGRVYNRCERLGYRTHPKYQFNCWDPKDRVKKRMMEER